MKITINGEVIEVQAQETLLAVARRRWGVDFVPTLCDSPNLKPFGSCRVCSVEVSTSAQGPWRVVGSCHTPAADGLFVQTHSPKVERLRKNILELVLSDHPLHCATCEANGSCELQKVSAQVGSRHIRYPQDRKTHFDISADTSGTYVHSQLSTCIACQRCVRACDEVQGQFVLSVKGRGFNTQIIKGLDQSFSESDCVSCGACVQACPTAALTDIYESKHTRHLNQTRTTCTYCGVGCNLQVATKNGQVHSISAPYDNQVNPGHTCVKGRYAFAFYKHPDRLRTPYIRKGGKLEPASWDEAFGFLKTKILELRQKHGPNSLAGISSARCTNEENYLMQKMMRVVLGTNNIDGCARVCHAPTALGMQRTFGTGAATNSIQDIKLADCFMVIGANPTSAHPVTGAKIKQAVLKGKKLIVLDPRKTELARLADVHLQMRPGTNVAVLNMMLHAIVHEGWSNTDFIQSRTTGFEEFAAKIKKLDLKKMEEVSQVPYEKAKAAAKLYSQSKNSMCFHGLGVTEHTQGTFAVMLIAELAMITGHLGRPGVGVNPLRGQNNVQGLADMGVQPHQGAGYLDVTRPENLAHYEKVYGVKVPSEVGLKIPQMMDAALEGHLKGLWIMGEDVMQTDPNTAKIKKALESLELLVVQELFMTDTAKLATVVLPGASFLEKSGTFTNGERRIQRVQQAVEPLSGTKPDGVIVSEMMNHLGYPQRPYDAAHLLTEISKVVPFFAGVTWERLGHLGLQWPVNLDGTPTEILHRDQFKIGKAPFYFIDFRESEELEENSEKFPLILTTVRDLVHYNCGTMTRRTPNVELKTSDVLQIHPADARERKIQDGQWVHLRSARGEVKLMAEVTDDVNPGVLCTTFHFPDVAINQITSDEMDSEALCPEYKVVAVDVQPLEPK